MNFPSSPISALGELRKQNFSKVVLKGWTKSQSELRVWVAFPRDIKRQLLSARSRISAHSQPSVAWPRMVLETLRDNRRKNIRLPGLHQLDFMSEQDSALDANRQLVPSGAFLVLRVGPSNATPRRRSNNAMGVGSLRYVEKEETDFEWTSWRSTPKGRAAVEAADSVWLQGLDTLTDVAEHLNALKMKTIATGMPFERNSVEGVLVGVELIRGNPNPSSSDLVWDATKFPND